MDPPGTPASVGSSVNRAKELTNELRRLQEHVESLDATQLQDNVAKVSASPDLCTGSLSWRAKRCTWDQPFFCSLIQF